VINFILDIFCILLFSFIFFLSQSLFCISIGILFIIDFFIESIINFYNGVIKWNTFIYI